MKKIAIILSGCGFKDGAEITESVSTLIALSEFQTDYTFFAPSMDFTSTDHRDDSSLETRNVLTESARIARGEIHELSKLSADNFDGLVLPGGFGAALHLCDFAKKGSGGSVHEDVKKIILDFYEQSKPIAAFCIAPALVSLVLGSKQVALTIGNDENTAKEIEKTGAKHVSCEVTDYITDRENKIVSSPAYMCDANPFEVFTGIRKALKEFCEMA